jgi:hypothetical protein
MHSLKDRSTCTDKIVSRFVAQLAFLAFWNSAGVLAARRLGPCMLFSGISLRCLGIEAVPDLCRAGWQLRVFNNVRRGLRA